MAVTPPTYANNAVTTIAGGAGGNGSPLNSGDTSLSVQAGKGASFPSTGPFMVLLGSLLGSFEIVKCTARSGDTLTITRGQEGTSATTWQPTTTTVEQIVSAGDLTSLWAQVATLPYNPIANYSATGNGSSDDTTALQNAITAASSADCRLPAGTFKISAPLVMSSPNTRLVGAGRGATTIIAAAGFSGSSLLSITADTCTVADLTLRGGPNASSASNPSITAGVLVSAARWWTLRDLECSYVNGYAVKAAASASVNLSGGKLHHVHVNHCAQGIYGLGNSGSNNVGQLTLSNIHLEAIDNGDGLFLEDLNDVQVYNIDGAVAGGATAGSMVRVRGVSSSVYLANVDLGMSAQGTSAATVLIESNANGSPTNVGFSNGVIQSGNDAVSITSGSEIKFRDIAFKGSYAHGVSVTGSTGGISFAGCTWQTSGQSGAASTYDLNITTSSNWVYVNGCQFNSAVGSGAGTVAQVVNDTNHRLHINDSHFNGTGTTPALCFNGTPQIVRGCPGYNPRGNITPPTITASPFSTNTSQNDVEIIFTAINTLTAFKIGGTAVGVLPVAGVPYHVPARSALELDYSGAAPTWQWYAD